MSDKLTLADLRVKEQYLPSRLATLADLVEVLESEGARDLTAQAFRQLGAEGKFGWRVTVPQSGTYLVIKIDHEDEETE